MDHIIYIKDASTDFLKISVKESTINIHFLNLYVIDISECKSLHELWQAS